MEPQLNINAASPDSGKPTTHKRGFVSAGEQIYGWVTYLGVDWIYNAAVGVSFAYWGKYTKAGQKYWSQPISKFFERTLKPLIKDQTSLRKSVDYGNMFVSIITGGMLTIPPLMVLERPSVKKAATQSLDKMIYGKEKVENDPKFKQAYDEIFMEPKKGFWSGLFSRFAALSPLLASVLYPPTRELLNKHYFKYISAASDSTFRTIGLKPERMFIKQTAAIQKERWAFIHDNVALDFGFGPWYAVLHKVFYNLFSGAGNIASHPTNTPIPAPAHNAPSTTQPSAHTKVREQPGSPTKQVQHISREQHLANVSQVSAVGATK